MYQGEFHIIVTDKVMVSARTLETICSMLEQSGVALTLQWLATEVLLEREPWTSTSPIFSFFFR